MATNGRTPRTLLDTASANRSSASFRATPDSKPESSGARGKRASHNDSIRSPKPDLSAMSKSELDDIYSLWSDDDQISSRHKVLKKAKTDVGPRIRSTHDNVQPTLPPVPSAMPDRKTPSQRQTRNNSDRLPPLLQRARSTNSCLTPSQFVASADTPANAPSSRHNSKSPLRLPDRVAPKSRVRVEDGILQPLSRDPSSTTPVPSATRPKRGRVRLIDRLAAQVEESSDSDTDRDANPQQLTAQDRHAQDRQGHINPRAKSPATPPRGEDTAPKISTQATQSLRRTNVRTYSQQRSIRSDGADDHGLEGLGLPDADPTPPLKLGKFDTFSFDDDEIEDARPKGGILGLHALRQAGANHRFSNELNDLFERIGTPCTAGSALAHSRRNALLELGRQLKDKKFVSQFCDDGSNESVFRHIGGETDIINGFVLVSALIVLLASSAAPHLVGQLRDDNVDKLLTQLFEFDSDIVDLARHRQHNLSKHGQASIQALKSAIVQNNSLWGPKGPPARLSPRTLALKALHMLSETTNASFSTGILRSLTPSLFNVVQAGKNSVEYAADDSHCLLDLDISLSLLQNISVAALEGEQSAYWLESCLPSVAEILLAVVGTTNAELVDIESLALKLAMNTSNSALSARTYGSDDLLLRLARVALQRFQVLHSTVSQGKFPADLYGRLVLVLGLLINITEHNPSSREQIGNWKANPSPLEGLIEKYLEHRESSGSADSYEQTSLAVAHGYLAILLGYMSMEGRTQRWLLAKSGGRGMQYLLNSIREFMALHEKVADAATDDMAMSLEHLVNEMQVTLSRET